MTHQAVRIIVSSPLGLLWQTHRVCKATGGKTVREFCNLSETLEPGESEEDLTSIAIRTMLEETGMTIAPERFRFRSEITETKPSPTTGQEKTYQFWDFDLELSQTEAEAIPLTLDEGDSFIYLRWRKSSPKRVALATGQS